MCKGKAVVQGHQIECKSARQLLVIRGRVSAMVLQAIKYKRGELQILDQLRLPHTEIYDDIRSSQDAWHAIKEMRTRGAPAIAIVAALALAVELETIAARHELSNEADKVTLFTKEKLEHLITSRPTAVNLADAARKLEKVVESAARAANATGTSVKDAYVVAAEKMLVDDVSDNEAIGRHGAEWILNHAASSASGRVSVLTHCNTGCALLHSRKRESPFSDLFQFASYRRLWYRSRRDPVSACSRIAEACFLLRDSTVQPGLAVDSVRTRTRPDPGHSDH